MRHNNAIPANRFRKHWQERIRTWFDQPGRKKRRRLARVRKSEQLGKRPVAGPLRPVVRCPTQRYNWRVRYGRGFTLEELRVAKISPKLAPTIGIAVDHRRRNRSEESLEANVARLKEYMARLVVFPRKKNRPRRGDETDPSILAQATQLKDKEIIPIQRKGSVIVGTRPIMGEERDAQVYRELRKLRTLKRYDGIRKKRALEKASQEEDKKK
jgi:large subunit ribosomal protein L13e